MASLKPKLFCGVALWGKFPSARVRAGAVGFSPTATHTIYATITVKRPYCMVEQRLHTYRTNWTLLVASDCVVRNGRLYGCHLFVSSRPRKGQRTQRIFFYICDLCASFWLVIGLREQFLIIVTCLLLIVLITGGRLAPTLPSHSSTDQVSR